MLQHVSSFTFGRRFALEQIQFLLGHVSMQTTERYLGCKQRLREAVNDKIGSEPVFS
jgi:site-specific recombinase XerD